MLLEVAKKQYKDNATIFNLGTKRKLKPHTTRFGGPSNVCMHLIIYAVLQRFQTMTIATQRL